MDLSQFHFAQTAWLWGLLAIPVVWIFYSLAHRAEAAQLLERFADRHLLVHLLKNSNISGRSIRIPLLLWAAAWICGVLAMAGPRWSYVDQQTFRLSNDLVIVLDLSQSMDATDVKPSRIARARHEIEDILNISHGTSIGLIAYAAVPHMVTPLTDDMRTLKNLLPALETSLVTIQGDRLKPALEMAARMLKAEPGRNKSILVISDGGFRETDFADLARTAGNATIYAMGIGTAKGAPVAIDSDGLSNAAKKAKVSRLQADRLRLLARSGNGLYVEADYTRNDTRVILRRVEAGGNAGQTTSRIARLWNERFYVPLLVLALLLLPLFRKGAAFPAVIFLAVLFFPSQHAQASTFADLFLNRNQQAQAAYERGDYKEAFAKFDTPYRRGVVAYRAKDYAKAALLFRAAANQKAGLDALYDLGNAQLMQDQPEDAIVSYKAVLKQRPGDVAARHNLAIAESMLKKSKEQKKDQKRQPPKDKQNKGGGGSQDKPKNQNQQQEKGGKQGPPKPQKGGQSQAKPGTQNKQTATPQKAQPQNGKGQAPQEGRNQQAGARQPGHPTPNSHAQKMRGGVINAPRRTQRDVNADEWLNRVQNDPGSFLKNQFMIEDQASGLKQDAQPR